MQVVWLLRAGAPSCAKVFCPQSLLQSISRYIISPSCSQGSRCIVSPSCSQYFEGASESRQLSLANHSMLCLVTWGVSTAAAVSLRRPYAAADGMGHDPPYACTWRQPHLPLGTPRITGGVIPAHSALWTRPQQLPSACGFYVQQLMECFCRGIAA